MEEQNQTSAVGRFFGGAIKLAAIAAIGLALFAAAGPLAGAVTAAGGWGTAAGWGAITTASTWTAASTGVFATVASEFAAIGAWVIGGSALAGGLGSAILGGREQADQSAGYSNSQSIDEKLGRGRGREIDFSGMDAGINRTDNWRETVRPTQSAGLQASVAQPAPRL